MNADMDTEGKYIVNALYDATITTGIAAGYAQIGKQLRVGVPPRLDFGGRDLLMIVVDMSLANMTKAWLVNKGIIPANIMN